MRKSWIRLSMVFIAMLLFVGVVSATTQPLTLSGGQYVSQSQVDRDLYGKGWEITAAKQINYSDTAPLSISLGFIKQDKTFTDRVNIPVILNTTITEGNTFVSVGAGAVYNQSKVNSAVVESSTKFCYQMTFGITYRQLFAQAKYLGSSKIGGYTLSVGSRF